MTNHTPILEVRLRGLRMLRFATGLGALAHPEHFETERDVADLTGAWRPREPVDGEASERWLRGLRPQSGARSAQEARARGQLNALQSEAALSKAPKTGSQTSAGASSAPSAKRSNEAKVHAPTWSASVEMLSSTPSRAYRSLWRFSV